jgi:protein transport protein SEC24
MTKNNEEIPQASLIHLSSANIDRQGVYLLDTYDRMYFYVGSAVSDQFCQDVLEVPNFTSIPEGMVSSLHAIFFINYSKHFIQN